MHRNLRRFVRVRAARESLRERKRHDGRLFVQMQEGGNVGSVSGSPTHNLDLVPGRRFNFYQFYWLIVGFYAKKAILPLRNFLADIYFMMKKLP